MASSKMCLVNGELVTLPRAPMPLSHGDWMVPESLIDRLGFSKPRASIRNPSSSWGRPMPVIVIDAGHGGKDPGAIGVGGTMEKDVVLDISRRVVARLKRERVTVRMTRDEDHFVDLHKRCEMSNAWRATVFVSIHCNAHGKREIEGYQLYRQSPSVSFKARADDVRNRFPLPQYTPIPKMNEQLNFSNHEKLFQWKDRESTTLSGTIHRKMQYRQSKVTTEPQKNLCVLRETMAPSVLVEVDFVSNPSVEIKMGLSSWREKMAEDIVRGILSYLGIGPQS
jgi:N-acetylmuramoyl-L-alanine amidase